MSTPYPEMNALIDKARVIQAEQEQCERGGGHWYQVDGFSQIAHPEVYWGDHPKVKSLSEIVFRAYVCRECGCRVSVEEGREYMCNKPLSVNARNWRC